MPLHFEEFSWRHLSSKPASLEALEEGLCGFLSATDGAVVKGEGRHVHWAAVGYCLRTSLRDGSVEAEGKRVSLLESSSVDFLQSCFR